jgi:hypothetical protein
MERIMTDQPKPNLEQDLFDSQYIRDKARNNDIYCQHLYATLCNNEFIKAEVLSILAAEQWSCSWRHSGGIAAGLYDGSFSGDYMRYYIASFNDDANYISEGMIDEEVREDLKTIGWYLVENKVNI